MSYKIHTAALLALTLHLPAQAALFDRGNGLIYDDVLDITWLQDANYAQTSGYAAANQNGTTIKSNGRMDWFEASNWASQLNYANSSAWRLPTLAPINGTAFDLTVSFDASTDRTYNLSLPSSELSYMYYVNLNNTSVFNPDGSNNPNGSGSNINATFANAGNSLDTISFDNLAAYLYWSNLSVGSEHSWGFGTINGMQEMYLHSANQWTGTNAFYAWAVHDGDIGNTEVPVPAAFWLFSSALLALFARRRSY